MPASALRAGALEFPSTSCRSSSEHQQLSELGAHAHTAVCHRAAVAVYFH